MPRDGLWMVEDVNFCLKKNCRHNIFFKLRKIQQKNPQNTIFKETANLGYEVPWKPVT